MGTVTLTVNGKPYVVGCEDGAEAHLRTLADRIDANVKQIAPSAGSAGETRLMLMAALMIADELHAAEARLTAADARFASARRNLDRLEAKVLTALDAATARLDAMAPD